MSDRKTDDATLIAALRILSRTITTEDGVIPACLAEVANRLETLVDERRWVPVGERLPEAGVDVLAISGEGVFQGRCVLWDDSRRWEPLFLDYHGCGCCGGGNPNVTHWRPLPPGPEANE